MYWLRKYSTWRKDFLKKFLLLNISLTSSCIQFYNLFLMSYWLVLQIGFHAYKQSTGLWSIKNWCLVQTVFTRLMKFISFSRFFLLVWLFLYRKQWTIAVLTSWQLNFRPRALLSFTSNGPRKRYVVVWLTVEQTFRVFEAIAKARDSCLVSFGCIFDSLHVRVVRFFLSIALVRQIVCVSVYVCVWSCLLSRFLTEMVINWINK